MVRDFVVVIMVRHVDVLDNIIRDLKEDYKIMSEISMGDIVLAGSSAKYTVAMQNTQVIQTTNLFLGNITKKLSLSAEICGCAENILS